MSIAVVLVCLPAVLALACACYFMCRWWLSRRGASVKSNLIVGALGPFAALAPRAMSEESAALFRKFLVSAIAFVGYGCILAVAVALVSRLNP